IGWVLPIDAVHTERRPGPDEFAQATEETTDDPPPQTPTGRPPTLHPSVPPPGRGGGGVHGGVGRPATAQRLQPTAGCPVAPPPARRRRRRRRRGAGRHHPALGRAHAQP